MIILKVTKKRGFNAFLEKTGLEKSHRKKEKVKLNWKEFKNDENIVIKEANKEGAAVILDSVHYEQIIYKQREDKNTCTKVDLSCVLWQ